MVENQLPTPSVFESNVTHEQDDVEDMDGMADLVKDQSHKGAAVTSNNLSKSTSSLPPFANSTRVAKIKTAISTNKDDDLERAQDSKFGGTMMNQHQSPKV